MTAFRVGDMVKRVKESPWPEEYGVLGDVYTILAINAAGWIEIISGNGAAISSSFELVERATELLSRNRTKVVQCGAHRRVAI